MKKLKIAILGLFLLIVSFYGWLEYRQDKSYIHALPQDVNQVLKVNLDQIYWEGFKYMIMHPSAITTKEDTVEKEDHGFNIGANLFFFTRKSSSEIIYLSIPIKDKKQAIEYLKSRFQFEQKEEVHGATTAVSSTLPLTVALDESRALFAYRQPSKDSIAQVLSRLYQGSPEETIMNRIKDEKDIISFLSKDITARLSFEKDQLIFSGEMGNFLGLISSIPFIKNYTSTSIDSLLNNIDYLSLQVQGLVSKTDTIVSYEYNDDFEKIETEEIKTTNFPGIYFYYVYKDTESLSPTVLETETWLFQNGFKKNCLTELSCSYSNMRFIPEPLPTPSEFADIEIDFTSLEDYELYYSTLPYSHSILNNLSIAIRKEEKNSIKWQGIIQLNKDVIKIISETNF